MATTRTDLRAAQYDFLRITEGITGNLVLASATATGYTSLATITAGWFAQTEEDRIDGTQYLAIRIAETDANLALITSTISNQVAALTMMSRRYKLRAKHDPMEDPRVWKFQCDPTGEAA